MATQTRDALTFSTSQSYQIEPYLPLTNRHTTSGTKPYVTLTFATSLDSNLAISPGVQTALSGPESKAMTHFLRSRHDAILIGVGTAVADNPSLNCRIEGVGGYGGSGLSGQPRPVVVDPHGRWDFGPESKCIKLAAEGKGKGPLLVTLGSISSNTRTVLESVGGKVLTLQPPQTQRIPWNNILNALAEEGVQSVMIEGGGSVINELLSPLNFGLVDSVVITVAPTWLGKGGVQVCPDARIEGDVRVPVGRLKDVKWVPLGDDVVLCGRPSS